MVRQSSFNSALLLRGQAYEIALQIREVQLSAVSATNDSNVGSFRSALGVYFDTSNGGEYKVFRDLDGDGYDSGEKYGLQGVLDARFEIRDIRVGSTTPDSVSIVYSRPNFDAEFYVGGSLSSEQAIEIDIARRQNNDDGTPVVRTVEVTRTGQISVN